MFYASLPLYNIDEAIEEIGALEYRYHPEGMVMSASI
jgi:hypothetical protein